jgi:lactoylglutathione lyase
MKVGRWLHTRFRVENLEKSLDFYQSVLGLRKISETKSPRGSRLVFLQPEAGGEMLELCHYPQSGPVQVPQDLTHIAFEVENLESFGRHASRLGYPWSDGPHEGGNGSKFAFLDAPEGYEVEIIQKGQPS